MPKERTLRIHLIGGRVHSRAHVDILEKKNGSPQWELNPNWSSSWPSYYTDCSKSNSHFNKWLLALQVPHLMSIFCSLCHSSPRPCITFQYIFSLIIFCTLTNQCTINWQIIILLLHVVGKTIEKFHICFMLLKSQCLKSLNLSYYNKMAKIISL